MTNEAIISGAFLLGFELSNDNLSEDSLLGEAQEFLIKSVQF